MGPVPDRPSLPVVDLLALLPIPSCTSYALARGLYIHGAVMSSASTHWGTLINLDKSPAPLLEQLCLGIAQLMVSTQRILVSHQTDS